MSEANKALVRRWFQEVWCEGREATIDEIMAPDARIHGLGEPMRGPQEFKQFFRAYRDGLPDISVVVDEMVAEGNSVACRWTAHGTHRGGGLGFAATGKKTQITGMTIAHFQNGRIVEGWNSFDQFGMLQQLGVVQMRA